MKAKLNSLYSDAKDVLRSLVSHNGILASSIESDNYKRVWARDSIICGIAGILAEDRVVIEGLKTSLVTLSKHQNDSGIIPSNVFESETKSDVSYGSLVGRVDTNTWFIVGACLYYINTDDEETWKLLKPSIEKSRAYLKHIEFNGKGWIYTPMSGNWADEYPIHGYTIYDNALRIWGESLFQKLEKSSDIDLKNLKFKTLDNFWPLKTPKPEIIYHQKAHTKAIEDCTNHFCSFILPGYYDNRFDAAGNGIALLNFNLDKERKNNLKTGLKSIQEELKKNLIPAFWPVIDINHKDWHHIQNNYSFDFKNCPHHFHNGGIWPVWMGWFCLGLANQGLSNEIENYVSEFLKYAEDSNWDFQEYISSDNFQLSGKHKMGFTASGIIFMYHSLYDESFKQKLGI